MADTIGTEAIRRELEQQISELRREVGRLARSVSGRGETVLGDLRGSAEDAYEEASEQARKAARRLKREARVVGETAREHPGAAATVLSSAGLVGFVLGFIVSQLLTGETRR